MKKISLIVVLSIIGFTSLNAQVGIGTPVPNNSAQLEVASADKGVLLPQVALTSTTDATAIANGNVPSLLVYNTATAGTAPNNVTPGYYYWNGSQWARLVAAGEVSNFETLTALSIEDNDNGTPGDTTDDFKELVYEDEDGTINRLNLSDAVADEETLTALSIEDNDNGTPADTTDDFKELVYEDEDGTINRLNLSDAVADEETLTSLNIETNDNGTPADTTDDFEELVYEDEDGTVNRINLTNAVANDEPWFGTDDDAGATNNTEDIYVMSNWVGIGTNAGVSPSNERLFVDGAIRTTNSYYADYVFETYFDGTSKIKNDYTFKSLNEVEDFVKTNKHLPGVPGIDDLIKSDTGYTYDLSQLAILSLEKIEELFLHAIELQKRLDVKNKQIETLENRLAAIEKQLNLKN